MISLRENDNREASAEILQRQKSHRITALGIFYHTIRNNTGHAHELSVLYLRFTAELVQRHEALQHLLVIAQRMVGNVKADNFLFVLQNKLLGNFRQRRQLDFRHTEAIVTEQPQLAVGLIPLAGSAQINRLLNNGQHLRASGTEGIHCAAFNHIFDNALVDHAHINTTAEIRQALERTALVAGADNCIDCSITGIFYTS